MATFKDLKGKEREVSITFRHLKLLRERNGLVVADLVKAEAAEMKALLQDPERFAAVLFTVCGSPGESADEFMDGLDLPTLEAAAVPFMEAVLSFCHGPRAGAVLARTMTPRVADVAAKKDAALDTLPAKLEAALTSNGLGGNSPASVG